MKKLLSLLTIGVLFCTALSSCEEDPSVSANDTSLGGKPSGGGSVPPADPAYLLQLQESIKGKTVRSLAVCNADGSNLTTIVAAASSTIQFWGKPTFSGNASSISYVESDNVRSYSKLTTRTCSVINGKPTAGSAQVIKSVTVAADSVAMSGGIWSPSTTEIAYSLQNRNVGPYHTTRTTSVYTIPSGGGSSELIYNSGVGHSIYYMAWSPDGSKLALLDWKILNADATDVEGWIQIVDRSSHAVLQSIKIADLGMSSDEFLGIDWSRGSSNILAITNINYHMYTIDLDQAPAATFVANSAIHPAWLPDNSKIGYGSYGGGVKEIVPSSGVTNSVTTWYAYTLDRKR